MDDPVFARVDVRVDLRDRLTIKRSDLQDLRRMAGDDLSDDAIHDVLNEWVDYMTTLRPGIDYEFDWDAYIPENGRRADLKVLYEAIREIPEPPPLPLIGQLDLEGNAYLG